MCKFHLLNDDGDNELNDRSSGFFYTIDSHLPNYKMSLPKDSNLHSHHCKDINFHACRYVHNQATKQIKTLKSFVIHTQVLCKLQISYYSITAVQDKYWLFYIKFMTMKATYWYVTQSFFLTAYKWPEAATIVFK